IKAEVNLSAPKSAWSTGEFRIEQRPESSLIVAPTQGATPDQNGNDNKAYRIERFPVAPPTGAITSIPDAAAGLSRIRSKLLNGAAGSPFAVAATYSKLSKDEFNTQQQSLDKLIAFPFRTLDMYPDVVKNGSVAIFDQWVDGSH